jgi:hypothetical protein
MHLTLQEELCIADLSRRIYRFVDIFRIEVNREGMKMQAKVKILQDMCPLSPYVIIYRAMRLATLENLLDPQKLGEA